MSQLYSALSSPPSSGGFITFLLKKKKKKKKSLIGRGIGEWFKKKLSPNSGGNRRFLITGKQLSFAFQWEDKHTGGEQMRTTYRKKRERWHKHVTVPPKMCIHRRSSPLLGVCAADQSRFGLCRLILPNPGPRGRFESRVSKPCI